MSGWYPVACPGRTPPAAASRTEQLGTPPRRLQGLQSRPRVVRQPSGASTVVLAPVRALGADMSDGIMPPYRGGYRGPRTAH